MRTKIKTTDARQGVELHHVRWVLAISIAAAAAAIAAVAVYVI